MIDKPDKQGRLVQKAALNELEQVYWIQCPNPYVFNFWQPWVQNYYGVNSIGLANRRCWPVYVWLDQDMKKEMRGRR